MGLISPFHSKHLEYGATDAEHFWTYSTPEEEYKIVRERAGFTDFSSQEETAIFGKDAFKFVQKLITNDLHKIAPGKLIYSFMLEENGNAFSDCMVFWMEENYFIIVCVGTKQYTEWIKKQAKGFDVYVLQLCFGVLSLQGPKSRDVLRKAIKDIDSLPYHGIMQTKIGEMPVIIARLAISGELGYEFYVHAKYAHDLWDFLINIGKEHNVRPFGFGALMLLVVEKGGIGPPDFYEGSSALELGFGWTVALDKGDFIGKDALLKRKNEGIKTKLVGYEVSDPKVIADTGDKLFKGGKLAGEVTMGAFGPYVKKSIGRCWVKIEYANPGEELEVEHAGKRTKIRITKSYRWYDPENKLAKV